ncbi:SUMF1/EgtB/PvdO family nonheme iron enzyme [Aestuariirhabdus sp. Z084]|uniref:bifunctional serine/threonine-protein kinase/formylglycine-generating enzyme family protein n=1 Tax=Aestuariirhabdus haliotis TaxID=2918751 RepID=UPI00201B463F|nr:bifunctional serine/threonine-protein kinase/formylglycine-generating enzyme family protein [Aestuariirhabdus haliotis]MCL6417549.1 SUMF1/EgtB/PvdO family nonheme iron enzyme [Aestuariirhabdus haliotis]MCL6421496.1 SUMF1/EgtB/PvdO family nonheme iron enzyme [Aestuariirhabdus haliotis]
MVGADINDNKELRIPGYRILREINRGGMSIVYLAIQESFGREVALKVMSPALATDPSFGERFLREANIVGRLSHPHIISVYDVGVFDQFYYIAMDYCPGQSLQQVIHAGLTQERALEILRQVAHALDFAHEKGFVHRDVKTENILFRQDGSAVLTDFGIAKALDTPVDVTSVGSIVGTPHYMSPEQAKGHSLDGRADIYSLGIVFYEMLMGKVPYSGDSAVAIGIKHVSQPVPELAPRYKKFQPMLQRMLAKNVSERYQRGAEIVNDIASIEGDTPPYELPRRNSRISGFFDQLTGKRKIVANQEAFGFEIETRSTEQLPPIDPGEEAATDIRPGSDTLIRAGAPKRRRRRILAAALIAAPVLYWAPLPWADWYQQSLVAIGLASNEPAVTSADESQQPASPVIELAEPVPTNPPVTINTAPPPRRFALTVNTQPDDALVVLLGHPDPYQPGMRLNEGEYQVQVARPGYVTAMETLRMDGKNQTISIKLQPETYRFSINATPADSKIRILNIKPRYRDNIALEPGRYMVEVSKKGFQPFKDWVELGRRDKSIDITLRPVPKAGFVFRNHLKDGSSGPSMVIIPPGSFMMGSKASEDEQPRHRVKIAKAFAISRHEIVFAQYDKFTRATGRKLAKDKGWGRNTRPAINVSWEDAQAYVNWLSKVTGKHYRLPTEAEWEYAARAGSSKAYWWGNAIGEKNANCGDGCSDLLSSIFSRKRSEPVGQYKANGFGLYDTQGNVAEWVEDCYANDYSRAASDGSALEFSFCNRRVARGGSFDSKASEITVSSRDAYKAEHRTANVGFRIVVELD